MASELPDLSAEWMETDGFGGFVSGTVGGFCTRRYHALLLIAQKPPTDSCSSTVSRPKWKLGRLRMRCRHRGGGWDRDSAYHQGTSWLWLMGPFVEAWVRVRGNIAEAKREARGCFLPALAAHRQLAVWDTSPRLPMPSRPTRRAVVRFRAGRSVSSCGSIDRFWRNPITQRE